MSEVVVTIKAGTGYDVPWVVFHGESIEEVEYQLDRAESLLEKAAYVSNLFTHKFNTAPKSTADLLKRELGAEVISVEPIYSEPDAPQVPAQELKPWERPAPAAAAAPKPWETQTGAPAPVMDKPGIKLPYAEKKEGPDGQPIAGTPYALQREFKNYFFQQRNKLNWNGGRKMFEFTSTPTPELLSIAREWAARLGGSVEG